MKRNLKSHTKQSCQIIGSPLFCNWQKRLLKDSKFADFHLYSFHISSGRLSASATGALIRAVLFYFYSLGKHITPFSEQKSGTLILPCFSVNILISTYNVLRIVILLIQHTNDQRAGLNGIKRQPTHCCLGSQQCKETSLQFPHIILAGAAEAPVTQLNN